MQSEVPGFEELDDLYREIILDHYRNPRNHRHLDRHHLHGKGFNPFCGDEIVLEALLDSQGRIAEVGLNGRGCSISQASASMMSQLVKGKTLAEAEALTALLRNMMQGKDIGEAALEELGDLAALEGVKRFPVRIKCALLPWTTLQDSIAEYRKSSASSSPAPA